MKQPSISLKVATDLFFAQLIWSTWFISFVLVAHIAMLIISVNTGNTIGDFLFFSHGSAKVYMLVIGIISAYGFLTYYVNQGVTRKDYFTGTVLGAIGVAIAITIIATALTGLEYLFVEMTNLPDMLERSLTGVDIENANKSISIFLPKEIVASTVLIHSNNWLLSMLMYMLNIFTLYIVGWFIGVGYYRFGWIIGFGFIAAALLFLLIGELLWGMEIGPPLSNWIPFEMPTIPVYGSVIGMILLFSIILWLIRKITKDITIKM